MSSYISLDHRWVKNSLKKFLNISSDKEYRAMMAVMPLLEAKWKHSNEQDFSAYSQPEYVLLNFKTHTIYSKENLCKTLDVINDEGIKIKSALDIGAGIGLSTFMLAINLKLNRIVYCDSSRLQRVFAKSIIGELDHKIEFASSHRTVRGHIDLIVAFEFFEHIKNPIAFLDNLIKRHVPKCISVANAFGVATYGHFSEYTVGRKTVGRDEMKTIFNQHLQNNGWSLCKKCKDPSWRRPTVWKR
jgi:SAM-dependent methyltransferase